MSDDFVGIILAGNVLLLLNGRLRFCSAAPFPPGSSFPCDAAFICVMCSALPVRA